MTTEMVIYSISYNNAEGLASYYQISKPVENSKIIDEVIEVCNNNWHIEGECGYIGELEGNQLLEVIEDEEIRSAIKYKDDIYRVEVAW